ncbi:MAG TPA: response regulator [Anaerolineaceae bacterium]|nr:response regulator [Anaerolineaceae bacterium]
MAVINKNENPANEPITTDEHRGQIIIIRILFLISIFSSIVFLALSFINREVGYYLLAISSLITVLFGVMALPRGTRDVRPFFVFLLSASYQLLIVLLASVLPSFQGIPYAILAIALALIISSAIPRSGISDWVVTIGVIGAIASIQLTLLALLPRVENQAISSVIVILAALLLIKVSEMFGERRVIASIRTKLLLISLALTLLPLIVLSIISSRFLQQSIQTRTNESLDVAAEQTRLTIDNFIENNLETLEIESSLGTIIRFINLPELDRYNSREKLEAVSTLKSFQAKEKIYVPSYAILDRNGLNLYDTDITKSGVFEGSTSYFKAASASGTSFASPVEFRPRSNEAYIYFIAPVKNESDRVIGYLRARYDARILQDLISSNTSLLGEGSYPILLDENGFRLADGFSPDSIHRLISTIPQARYDELVNDLRLPDTIPLSDITIPQNDLALSLNNRESNRFFTANVTNQQEAQPHSGVVVSTQSQPWSVLYLQDRSILTSAVTDQNRLSTTIGLLVAGIISLFVVLAASQFTKPIIELTKAAGKVAEGDLAVQARVTTDDEIGTLGKSFNTMTLQLRDLVETLESRVRERTRQLAEQNEALQLRSRQLQTVADVARNIVSTRQVDSLLELVTRLVSERFGFYHSGIFLLDEASEYAVLRAASSPGGIKMLERKHKLRVGQVGIVGYVTGTGEPRIATDVGADAVFFNNPDLPETRSEMALPLKLGDLIIGALDVQSIEPDAFTQEDIALFTTLADQISVAIENANAYEVSQQNLEEMKELDRVKSQFLANMSHELRTPLNSVIGFSRVILKGIDGPINETQAQDITAIYNSGMHLLNMINEILDMSKIEAGKMELQVEEMSIADVITKAVETSSGLVKDKPIQLLTQMQPDLPLIKGDEVRIEQVLANLISNAAKFTEKGTITVSAELETTEHNREEIIVKVADTGIGIAYEDQPKLFQQFSQVDDSPTRRTGGTGLGLSICRSLIELHGGTIGLLNSEIGKGSTFYFTLPLTAEPQLIDTEVHPAGTNVVLAIDDDPQVITLYERFLEPYGYSVVPLTDPLQAVSTAMELKPFAITLDVMMPEKDGWQVLSELKNNEETRHIPVMICSILEEEEKGFNLGASDYLVKPFLHDELVSAIKRLNKNGDVHDILIIDDDPQYLHLLQKMIEEEGNYLPVLAEGGLTALTLLEDFTPDVILMDLVLEDINGFELLNKFKSEPRINHVPVIILTGSELDSEQLDALGDYKDQIFDKWSITKDELLANLHEALGQIKAEDTES